MRGALSSSASTPRAPVPGHVPRSISSPAGFHVWRQGLAWIAFREDGSINSPIVKFFSDEEMAALRERMDVEPGDLVMFAAGPRLLSDEILGRHAFPTWPTRSRSSARATDFLWVVNFPRSIGTRIAKFYAAEHQPFTLPTETDIAKIEADPLAAVLAPDFVMDGFEAGGGGMRIHNAEMQMSMLKLLGFTEERAELRN